MAAPNPQLQSALSRFAGQPGVSADHLAQLRSAITRDPALLKLLNEDAANGRLTAFALSEPTDRPNLAGTLEISSGTVTLPASGFGPQRADDQDLVAVLRLQDMAIRYSQTMYPDPSGNPAAVNQAIIDNLQQAINGSPVLAEQIKKAATPQREGDLAPLRQYGSITGTVAGGSYEGLTGTMNVSARGLNKPVSPSGSAELSFVLGHEIQHAFNHPDKVVAARTLNSQLRDIATDQDPINNYSAPIKQFVQASRTDEAMATIAGWNALLSMQQQITPGAGIREMANVPNTRILDFMDIDPATGRASLRPGITLNQDSSISFTKENIEALGKYYFDQPPNGTPGFAAHDTMNIGYHGDSDYANTVGAFAVSRAIFFEQHYAKPIHGVLPQMHLDMADLRLNETLLERNGIKLAKNPDQPQPYFDSSQNPPAPGRFHHTDTNGQSNSHRYVPVQPTEYAETQAPAVPPASHTPADRSHRDHANYERIHQAVRQAGRWDDTQSQNIAASALAAFKADPLSTRLDSVAVVDAPGGPTVFTVCSPWGDKGPHFHTQTNAQQAAQTPAERSFDQLEQLNQRSQQTTSEPTRGGPKLH